MKLQQTGRVTQASTAEETNQFLAEDDEYIENQVLYNMKEVIVELFGMILVRTYGELNEDTCKKILALKCFSDLYDSPDFGAYVKDLDNASDTEKLDNVLFTGFGFIRESIRRWLSANKQKYLSNQRRIRFLHSATTIEAFKEELRKTNTDTKRFGYEWKGQNVEFFGSLPNLT